MGKAKKKVRWIEKCDKVYYNPKQPGSYSGVEGLKRATGYKTHQIKNWLSKQDTYTLHRPAYRKFQRRRVIVPGINYQWAADLVDVSSLKTDNDGHTFLLTVIDVFSKKAACAALLRKSGPCVARAFKTVLEEADTPPKKLQTDKGSEFYNKDVKPLLKQYKITMFSTENDDIKSGIIERFNRTLKSRMWKYFTANNTHRYLDVLQDFINSYNNNYHSSIKMTPNQVRKDNEHEVWNNLYGTYQNPSKPKLKLGDCVRISKTSRTFKKGYMPNWSEELFTVASVLRTIPVTYRIKEENDELIAGTFYEKELQKVERKKVFEIEAILDTRVFKRQKQSFVKWKGYPNTYNTWINNNQLQKLYKAM
jgi:transposase InsO family protein